MHTSKASRRPALTKEFMETTEALQETLDKVSAELAAAVNHDDPVIDQLLSIKQTAWLLRNFASEASVVVLNRLTAGHATSENRQTYTKFVGGIDAAWNALELATSGMQLPANLVSAMAGAKADYFDPQYTGSAIV